LPSGKQNVKWFNLSRLFVVNPLTKFFFLSFNNLEGSESLPAMTMIHSHNMDLLDKTKEELQQEAPDSSPESASSTPQNLAREPEEMLEEEPQENSFRTRSKTFPFRSFPFF